MAYRPPMSDVNKWVKHFRDVVAGKIPGNQDFYVVETISSPSIIRPRVQKSTCDTQQVVDQAKAKLRHAKFIKVSTAPRKRPTKKRKKVTATKSGKRSNKRPVKRQAPRKKTVKRQPPKKKTVKRGTEKKKKAVKKTKKAQPTQLD